MAENRTNLKLPAVIFLLNSSEQCDFCVQVSRGNKRPFFGILELSRRKLGSIHGLRKNIHCSFSPVFLSLQAVGRS